MTPRPGPRFTPHYYFQLIRTIVFHSVILAFPLFMLWTLLSEVSAEQRRVIESIRSCVAQCGRDYSANNCSDPVHLPPALKGFCADREDCLGLCPLDTSLGTIAARCLGRLIDEFIAALSPRTIFTLAFLLCGLGMLRFCRF
jgi:hypothetical protein